MKTAAPGIMIYGVIPTMVGYLGIAARKSREEWSRLHPFRDVLYLDSTKCEGA